MAGHHRSRHLAKTDNIEAWCSKEGCNQAWIGKNCKRDAFAHQDAEGVEHVVVVIEKKTVVFRRRSDG